MDIPNSNELTNKNQKIKRKKKNRKEKTQENLNDLKKQMQTQTVLIAGCYEKALFGYILQEAKLFPSFNSVVHDGYIRVITTSGILLVSASSDETMKVFNLEKKIELGTLFKHSGPVTCIEFHDKFLFSGSEDGTICIWKVKGWECILTLAGHKAGVLSLSIHPSGKMCLSTSKDCSMKMWNLIKGKCAITNKLEKVGERILWSKDGNNYAVMNEQEIILFSTDDTSKRVSISQNKRALTMVFITDSILASAGEDKSISFWDTNTGISKYSWIAHTNRVKEIVLIPSGRLVSVSSDGFLKVWSIENLENPILVSEVNTTARLTCVTYAVIPVNEDISTEENLEEEKEKKRKIAFEKV